MRKALLVVAALLVGVNAWAVERERFKPYEPERGAQIASLRSERLRGAAVLASLRALPILPQVVVSPGGGGVVIGTTPITGGATTQVLYNLSGVVNSDSGFTRSGVNGTTTIDNGSGAVSILVLEDNNSPVATFADNMRSATFNSNGLGLGAATPTDVELYVSSTSSDFQMIHSDATGYASFAAGNSAGTIASSLVSFGASATGTNFGVARAGMALVQAYGTALTSLAIGPTTADPLILGASDITRYYIEDATKSVTDNTATTLFTVTLGDDTWAGGTVSFCAFATSAATDGQTTCGQINFAMVDVTAGAGGESCSAAVTGTNSTAVSAGTLTVTAAGTTGTDLCNVQVTADSSLNVASLIRYQVHLNPGSSAQVVNPQ